MTTVKKVVLAYSGGLDTSIIIPWLKENVRGRGDRLLRRRRPGRRPGGGVPQGHRHRRLASCVVEDLREEFVRDYAFKALAAGAVYEDNYLLGTALARPLHRLPPGAGGARARAPTRWPTAPPARATTRCASRSPTAPSLPHLKVIAPWREWDIRSREDALDYAAAHGVPVDADAHATSSAATATCGTSRTRAATSRTPGTRRSRRCSS